MKRAEAAPLPPFAKDLSAAQKRALVLSMPCSKCGAAPGGKCRTPNGNPTAASHAARYTEVTTRKLVRW